MKKENLLLLSIIVFSVFLIPSVFALENSFIEIAGNDSALTFLVTREQVTTNPTIGGNITYVTWVNVSDQGAGDCWNVSSFKFYLPDNRTTSVLTDFTLKNGTNITGHSASSFTEGDYNHINFTFLGRSLNCSDNSTGFNITYVLNQPISATKLSETRSGRAYTATWNITSSATNLSIDNASLMVVPVYWYTKIGNPTTIQFNSTTKSYALNTTSISVYTNVTYLENIHKYGSGWGTLKVIFNGPTLDTSSGSSPSKAAPLAILPETIAAWFTPQGMLFFSVTLLVIGGIVTTVIVLLKRKKK